MKRPSEREPSPGMRRSRSSFSEYESRERDNGREFDRGERMYRGPSPPMMQRERKYEPDFNRMPSKERYMGGGGEPNYNRGYTDNRMGGDRGENMNQDYRTICISNFNTRVPDQVLRDALYTEFGAPDFQKYGEFNVKVVHNPEQGRIAYINFKYPDDAKDAKHAKKGLVMFEIPCRLSPVIHKNKNQNDFFFRYQPGGSGGFNTGQQGGQGGYQNNYNRGQGQSGNNMGGGRPGGTYTNRNTGGYNPEYGNAKFEGSGDYRGPQDKFGVGTGDGFKHKEHKFPYHLHHVDPEGDPNATRTLFVGNLDIDIEGEDVAHIFGAFGEIDDIDIKKPQVRGQGNAYAFVKYMNLDMAHRAKVEMSGKYIGKFQCKIGYGKVNPTTCLWVGNIGPGTRKELIEQEFDRFGVIQRLEWRPHRSYVFCLYDSIDAAQEAAQQMRGMTLPRSDRRLRIDFVDPSHMDRPSPPPVPPQRPSEKPDPYGPPPSRGPPPPGDYGGTDRGYGDKHVGDQGARPPMEREWGGPPPDKQGDYYPPRSDDRGYGNGRREGYGYEDRGRPPIDGPYDGPPMDRPRSPPRGGPYTSPPRERIPDNDMYSPVPKRRRPSPGLSPPEPYERIPVDDIKRRDPEPQYSNPRAETLSELAKCLPVVWNGALVLKNSAFAARMHLVTGDVHLVDTLMRDPTSTEMPELKITQRLRLDQPKLEEVGRRVSTAGTDGHAVLLAMPGSSQVLEENSARPTQHRPLKNLVTYLKQKEAAGVISLPPNPSKDKDNIGVLHAFPPCQFGLDYLNKRSPNLKVDREDHLIVIVVKGAV